MVKNFELKYLTSEKEKNKIIKQYNELESRFNKIKEKNEMNVQRNEEFLRLEKNNYVLLQTNEDLKKQINEINIQNDFVKKKYSLFNFSIDSTKNFPQKSRSHRPSQKEKPKKKQPKKTRKKPNSKQSNKTRNNKPKTKKEKLPQKKKRI